MVKKKTSVHFVEFDSLQHLEKRKDEEKPKHQILENKPFLFGHFTVTAASILQAPLVEANLKADQHFCVNV